MKEGQIRVMSSDPKLNRKIQTRVPDSSDGNIYWYIKFNLKLDPESITGESMYVTDLGGFVMNTYIEYDTKQNMISISPLMSYEQEYYYLLNITTKVKSEKGNNLKKHINILFKLVDDQINNFEILNDKVQAPIPRKRPDNYDPYKVKSKVYGLDKEKYQNIPQNKLPPAPLDVNPLFALISLILLIGAVVYNDTLIIIIMLMVAILAFVLLLRSILQSDKRAIILYNKGVRQFNKEDFVDAKKSFEKAFKLDEYNEMIEYALNKVEFYL